MDVKLKSIGIVHFRRSRFTILKPEEFFLREVPTVPIIWA